MKILLKSQIYIKKYGLKLTISKIISYFISNLNLLTEIDITRNKINYDIAELFKNEVRYGIFKEMKLSKKIWWGKFDVATKLLGQYESHVLDKIIEYSKYYNTFIDIGAADGYYSIGVVFSNLFNKSICFEISEIGRKVIEENAILNRVQEKIKIYDIANTNSIKSVLQSEQKALILIDIEGSEYSLLSDEFLLVCKNSTLIIELHDNFIKRPEINRNDLFNRASKHFDINYIERANPEIYSFIELDYLNDNCRQLVFSEGRPIKMEWICLTPKSLKN